MTGIDELVAGLKGVGDDQIAGPDTPGAREMLTAIMAEEHAVSVQRPRKYARLAIGAVAATAVVTTTVIALNAGGPGPTRSYANAAVDIQRAHGGTYKVHIKNVYADQRQFHDAFAKFGLDVTLSIVPVSPGSERKIVGGGGDDGSTHTIGTVLSCPPGRGTACPLTVEISGMTPHKGSERLMIGRTARPGETYWNQRVGAGDSPRSLGLTGHTVAEALKILRKRSMTAAYQIGEFRKEGSGYGYAPPSGWRPQAGRRVTGAWMRSSDSVGLLVAPVKGDPQPVPGKTEF
jgi:hypothetical protein